MRESLIQNNHVEKYSFINFRNKTLNVRLNDKRQTISIDDISYLESDSNYTIFHFKNGNKSISSFTMKHHIQNIRDSSTFFRINRAIFLNINEIYRIKGDIVILKNRSFFRVSRRRLKPFVEIYEKL